MRRKSKVTKATTTAELPKGYKAITGGGSWKYKELPLLEGVLIKFGSTPSKFSKKKGDVQRFAIIATGDGDVTVWESAGTRALFDVKPKKKVCIAYRGEVKIKGRKQSMHDFVVGVA